MPNLTWLAKQKWVRDGVAGSARVGTKVPASTSVASSDNSHGSAQASAEILQLLDASFDEFDSKESISLNAQHTLRRLLERAQKYSNFGLPVGVGSPWAPSGGILDQMQIAVACSVNVYDKVAPLPQVDGYQFQMLQESRAARDGVKKAIRFFRVDKNEGHGATDQEGQFLLIAIRGTVSKSLDWVANLNYDTHDSQEFLNLPSSFANFQSTESPLGVHAGFLNAAKALMPLIEEHINRIRSTSIRHVLFTGHSAGGAVASMTYLRALSHAKERYPGLKFSLMTFGCPPVTSQPLTAYLNSLIAEQEYPGIALAIVNEHDPIPRADSDYVKSIIALSNEYGALGLSGSAAIDRPWVLPTPHLYILGNIMVLKEDDHADELEVKMYSVEVEDFSQLLFCDRLTHKKIEYLERIQSLRPRELDEMRTFMYDSLRALDGVRT